MVVLRWPVGSSDERRGDEVRRRSGTCPLDQGPEELPSFGAGHAREPGGEAAASSGWPGAECEGGFWIEERVASSVDLEDPEEDAGWVAARLGRMGQVP